MSDYNNLGTLISERIWAELNDANFLFDRRSYTVQHHDTDSDANDVISSRTISHPKSEMPNTHRRRRRDETVELRRVGGVNTPVGSREYAKVMNLL